MSTKDKKVRHKKSNRGFIIIFVLGLLLLGYPLSGQVISFYQAHQSIKTYEKELGKIKPEEMAGVTTLSQFCDYIQTKVGDKA